MDELVTKQLIDNIKHPKTNNHCQGYVLVTKVKDNVFDYEPHLNCTTATNSAFEDGLVLHYKFPIRKEPVENGVVAPDFSSNINGYQGVVTERIKDSNSFTGYALKISHVSVDNQAARVRFNVKPGFTSGTKTLSVYAKAEGNFIGKNLYTYSGADGLCLKVEH